MHLLVLGAFCLWLVASIHEGHPVLMHLLVLGAFCLVAQGNTHTETVTS